MPSIPRSDQEGKLESGQQVIHTINADKFTMRIVVRAEKNCVLTSQQVSWYDPVSREDMSRSKNEIFLTHADDV
jgi:hypothetical protein